MKQTGFFTGRSLSQPQSKNPVNPVLYSVRDEQNGWSDDGEGPIQRIPSILFILRQIPAKR
jgi:hypothetical protein